MTTYTEDSPEPGPEVVEVWDRDDARWQRNPTDGYVLTEYPDGWHSSPVPTTRPTRFPVTWERVVTSWAPLDDRLDDPTQPTEPVTPAVITPEIRMWALDFALNAMRLTAEHGTFKSEGIDLLTIADAYIGYVITGEHFE